MEEAVEDLPHATTLCKNIALGPGRTLVEEGK
jgi:hypothetical protein